jgi:hypothetical protein
VVTVYYFNDSPEHERQINATIWDPRLAGKEGALSLSAAHP